MSGGERGLRLTLVVAGVLMMLVGGWHLRDATREQLVSVVLWLGGGVVAHDAVIAPVTVLVLLVGVAVVPRPARLVAALGLLVWGTVTLATANVLLGVGGRPDNDTLLGRPYVPWWLALSALWWAVVAAAGWWQVRRRGATSAGQPDDRPR